MNTLFATKNPNQTHPWLPAVVGLMLALAGMLLTGFVAVVNGSIERGELRRENQSLSGSRLLPDEVRSEGVALGAVVLVPSELVASAAESR